MTDSERTVWGVTSYDRGGNAGFVVHCLFTTRGEAEKYTANDEYPVNDGGYEIEEFVLYGEAPAPFTYWHRGSSVFPDGTHDDWENEKSAQPPWTLEPVDDHLNKDRVWDGHTQSHCGEHISIFGTDRRAIEVAFQRHLMDSMGRQDGKCAGCGRTGPYQSGWMGELRQRKVPA